MTFFEMINLKPGTKFRRGTQPKIYQWEPGMNAFMVDEKGCVVSITRDLFESHDWEIICEHPRKLWEPKAGREFQFGWGIICQGCNQALDLIDPKVELIRRIPEKPLDANRP